MADDIDISGSDNEVDDAVHANLVAAVTQLEGKQRVKASVRKEPSTEVSEFHLVKSGTGKKGTVHLHELARVLGKRSSHNDITQKLKDLKHKGKKLPKPLEKPEANRIDRVVRFENVKKQLGRWDAVVQTNRLSDNLTFPLNQPNIGLEKSSDFVKKFTPETVLEVEMAKVLNKNIEAENENAAAESEFPLSLQEMVERRKELAKLRAQQNYREAKACRQNKIKSKKYHRILRREKVKQKLKDFEALKISDPEAALKQLDELDRTRAEERASLRHRSTGQWAKNKAVRAKYDTESRKVLAQQLSISRDLTQKTRTEESSDEDDEDQSIAINASNPTNNPWVGPVKTSAEVADFVSGYRKYYDQQAKTALEPEIPKEDVNEEQNNIQQDEKYEIENEVQMAISKNATTDDADCESILLTNGRTPVNDTVSSKKKKLKNNINLVKCKRWSHSKDSSCHAVNYEPNTKPSIVQNEKEINSLNFELISSSGKWIVTPTNNSSKKRLKKNYSKRLSEDIDGLFNNIKNKFEKNVENKLKKYRSDMYSTQESTYEVDQTNKRELPSDYLAFKKPSVRPDVDEQLNEDVNDKPTRNGLTPTSVFQPIGIVDVRDQQPIGNDIDPNKFMVIKPKHLKTQLPDIITAGDEAIDDETEKHLTIMEAFADDDVVAEFRKDKEEAVKSGQPEDISLAMPGWGSWGGKDIPVSKRKKRRFMLKKPTGPPRKDSAFGDVIISEERDKKMREHLVNSLPFPFTSVKSYEASIRAPIGNTWIPETSFQKLIAPRVQTKMGAIIQPMDERSLVNKNSQAQDIKWK